MLFKKNEKMITIDHVEKQKIKNEFFYKISFWENKLRYSTLVYSKLYEDYIAKNGSLLGEEIPYKDLQKMKITNEDFINLQFPKMNTSQQNIEEESER